MMARSMLRLAAGTGSSGRRTQRQGKDVGCRASTRPRAPGTMYACLSARVSHSHTLVQVSGPRLTLPKSHGN
jgi:hypothetical protein